MEALGDEKAEFWRHDGITLSDMTWRPPYRVVLHLLLVAFLAIPGIAAPARAVFDAMAVAAGTADAMDHNAPCDPMRSPSAGQPPCDCCDSHTCDFSACLGTGCLPELTRLVASIPPAIVTPPWRRPPVPGGMIETPFRPPIA